MDGKHAFGLRTLLETSSHSTAFQQKIRRKKNILATFFTVSHFKSTKSQKTKNRNFFFVFHSYQWLYDGLYIEKNEKQKKNNFTIFSF